jgi:hypothetical protein
MNREDAKCAAAKREILELQNTYGRSRISGAAIRPGLDTAAPQPKTDPPHPVVGLAMSAAAVAFLNLRHLPARLTLWQFGYLMGMSESEVDLLIKNGILIPANVGKGTVIYIPLALAMKIRRSAEWITDLTQAINHLYRADNLRKKEARADRSQNKEPESKTSRRRAAEE